MRLRTSAGRLLSATVVGVGVILAVVGIPAAGVVAVVVLGAVAGAVTASSRWVQVHLSLLGVSSPPGRVLVLCATFLALAGFTATLGASGMAVGVGTLGASLWLCSQAPAPADGGNRDVDPSPETEAGIEHVPPGSGPSSASLRATADLSDVELCQAWRISYLFLSRSVDPGAMYRMTLQRQEYLNEIERRYPEGCARWLASGARAASDPRPFLGVDKKHG